MDKHMNILCRQHLETKFVKVGMLNIQVESMLSVPSPQNILFLVPQTKARAWQ